MITCLVLLAGLLAVPEGGAARSGDPDAAFNHLAQSGDASSLSATRGFAVDQSGRIYVSVFRAHSEVARFQADGALDLSFGGGDGTRGPPPESDEVIEQLGLGILPSGELATACNRHGDRVLQDCLWIDDPDSPDPGVIRPVGEDTARWPVFSPSPPTSLDVGREGEMVLIAHIPHRADGSPQRRGQRRGKTIFRFHSNGFLATSFGRRGRVIIRRGDQLWRPRAVKLDSRGRPVILTTEGVARLRANGSQDKSFGRNGFYRAAWARQILVDDRDRIVVSGEVREEARLIRLLQSGRRDRSFSGDGRVVLRDLPKAFSPRALTSESNDRVIVGFSAFPSMRNVGIRLLRLGARGQRDSSFGDGGWVRYGQVRNAGVLAVGTTPGRVIVEAVRYFRRPNDPRLENRLHLLAFER